MQSTYRIKANELSMDIIKALKTTYHDREIEIIVQDVQDETEYLMATQANRDFLLSAIEDIRNNRNMIEVSLDSICEDCNLPSKSFR